MGRIRRPGETGDMGGLKETGDAGGVGVLVGAPAKDMSDTPCSTLSRASGGAGGMRMPKLCAIWTNCRSTFSSVMPGPKRNTMVR